MIWREIQSYFDGLVQEARQDPSGRMSLEFDSIRFALMCMILEIEPKEARQRVLRLAREEPGLREAS